MENWPGSSGLGPAAEADTEKFLFFPLYAAPARHYYCNSDNDNNNDINM